MNSMNGEGSTDSLFPLYSLLESAADMKLQTSINYISSQNIRHKVKKSSKIGQEEKTLITASA